MLADNALHSPTRLQLAQVGSPLNPGEHAAQVRLQQRKARYARPPEQKTGGIQEVPGSSAGSASKNRKQVQQDGDQPEETEEQERLGHQHDEAGNTYLLASDLGLFL